MQSVRFVRLRLCSMPPRLLPDRDFDAMKFDVLEHCASQASKALSLSGDGEELAYDFLERCDAVVHRTVSIFLRGNPAPFLSSFKVRSPLTDRVECLPFEDFLTVRMESERVASCIELLEILEDPAVSWFAVYSFDRATISSLYATMIRFAHSRGKEPVKVRALFGRLIEDSFLLQGEEKARFQVRIHHAEWGQVLSWLERFLQAHLEYGSLIQGSYLQMYPTLRLKVWENLWKEARRFWVE